MFQQQDVLSSFKSSSGLLDGLFPSKAVPSLDVDLHISFGSTPLVAGQELSQASCSTFPSRVDFVADSDTGYTLVLCDPDAPNAKTPTSRSFLHLIKPNLVPISADELVQIASSGEEPTSASSSVSIPDESLMPWMAPSPGKGSGPHRYAFLLLRQKDKHVSLSKEHPLREDSMPSRRHFNVESFAKEVGGEVVGATWFVVKGAEE